MKTSFYVKPFPPVPFGLTESGTKIRSILERSKISFSRYILSKEEPTPDEYTVGSVMMHFDICLSKYFRIIEWFARRWIVTEGDIKGWIL